MHPLPATLLVWAFLPGSAPFGGIRAQGELPQTPKRDNAKPAEAERFAAWIFRRPVGTGFSTLCGLLPAGAEQRAGIRIEGLVTANRRQIE